MPENNENTPKCDQEDQPNRQTDGGEAITGGTSAIPGSATLNGAGTGAGDLRGEYLRNPENTAAQVYEKEEQHRVPNQEDKD